MYTLYYCHPLYIFYLGSRVDGYKRDLIYGYTKQTYFNRIPVNHSLILKNNLFILSKFVIIKA